MVAPFGSKLTRQYCRDAIDVMPPNSTLKFVGWGEARTPTSTKSPIVGFHFIQPNLRVGDYRVFFEFDGSVHIIDIEEVRKRDERTY